MVGILDLRRLRGLRGLIPECMHDSDVPYLTFFTFLQTASLRDLVVRLVTRWFLF